MPAQMTVNLPLEKARQRLLKYFETRDDINVKTSEPESIQVRTSGWKHPWINIKIGIFRDGDGTRLAIDFSLIYTITILAIVMVLGIAFIWILPQTMFESIVLSVVILACALPSFAFEIRKGKRKFLEDIHKAFNKTD